MNSKLNPKVVGKKSEGKLAKKSAEVEEDQEQDDAVIGRAFLWSVGIASVAAIVGISAYVASVAFSNKPVAKKIDVVLPQQRTAAPVTLPKLPLKDITKEAGIDFQHFNGMDGEKLLPETMGGGAAFFDYDHDGDQDLLFINSAPWPWSTKKVEPLPTMKLYANDGKGKFSDATEASGLNVMFYGMGVAVGDYDNDGWTDLFISAVGKDHLFHNDQGKFTEVTDVAGVGGEDNSWSTSSCFFDYDQDGRLDLFVCNYVQWSREIDLTQEFSLTGVGRAYGPPAAFKGTFAYLYHNEGNGKFTDVSEKSGIQIRNSNTNVPTAKGLGVAAMDADRDGWLDLMVANDTVQNFLFINQKDGTFRENGIASNVAFDRGGKATGAMGVDCGMVRNDDTMAIVIGNFANEPCSFYLSRGKESSFVDAATATGVGPLTRLSLTFGVFFADLDLDSRLDLVCANGQLEPDISKVQSTQQYAQPPQLFWNAGKGGSTEFLPLTAEQLGDEALQPMVGRGTSFADIDGDGDLDVLLVANGGTPRLLRNDQATGNHWLRVKLVGKKFNADGIGATVRVYSKVGGKEVIQERIVMPTRSYLSQVELPITFGLGTDGSVEKVEVIWSGDSKQTISPVTIDQVLTVEQTP